MRRDRVSGTNRVTVIESKTGLGGVRKNPAQVGALGENPNLCPLCAGVERPRNGIDGFHFVNDLTGGETLDCDVVATASGVERIGTVPVGGLHDDDLANGR